MNININYAAMKCRTKISAVLILAVTVYYIDTNMASNNSVRPKIDIYRAAGIFIIAVAICLVLGEYVARPLLLPPKIQLDIDIKMPSDTIAVPKKGPRCC